ncbi:MAG: damage-inducible protein CinA [Bacteroidetes bacterium GWA2_31_9]|nr:MAG: damage-inducible protein CinA [Bacteroidetes bacterium GWA2_31_9]
MKSEIITIGDEILIGQIVDTNSAWMAQKLNSIGISVCQITSISDERNHILTSLQDAENRANIILVTGGLGPTKDDITKNTVCEYFDSKLIMHEKSLLNIKTFLEKRGVNTIIDNNRNQAMIPDNCIVLENFIGTAPGMWFEKAGKIFVFMPGVPFEMQFLVTNEVLPRIKAKFTLPEIVHKTIQVYGIPEAHLAEKISDWENSLDKRIKLAYLPSPGLIKLRFSTKGSNRKELQSLINSEILKLKEIIPSNLISTEEKKIEEVIADLLKSKKSTLSTAESCTGGAISQAITSISGSSEYFVGSVISYSNDVKINELGVDKNNLLTYGAVSKEVVEQMANGVRNKLNTNYSIAVSGIAGPSGGTAEKPVGTIWIAVASENNVISKKYQFGDDRLRNIERAKNTALDMLRKLLLS